MKALKTTQTEKADHFGRQRTGLLCYIVGMVVILTVYRVMLFVIARLNLFNDVVDYQKHVEGLATFLLFLMLGLLWLAYRQWQSIIAERNQLEVILESIGPDVLIAIDRSDRILRCGGGVEQMSGYTPEELIGKKTTLLYNDRRIDGQNFEIQSAIKHAGFHIGYATGRTKDGKDYLLEIQTSGLRSHDGGAVLILHNLDERRQSNIQLQRRLRMEETFAAISTEFLHAKPEQFGAACMAALQKTAGIFEHEFASVAYFDLQNGHTLRDIWTWPRNPETGNSAFYEDLAQAGASISTDHPTSHLFPEDLNHTPSGLTDLHTKWKIRSVALAPMQLQGRCFGVLAIYSRERHRRWAPEDTTILQALSTTFLSGELSRNATQLLQDFRDIKPPAVEAQQIDEGQPES